MPYTDPETRRTYAKNWRARNAGYIARKAEHKREKRAEARAVIVECECGLPKRIAQTACDRCEWLDGRTNGDQEIISLFRELGPLTAGELTALTGRIHRAVYASLQRLIGLRRVQGFAAAGGGQDQAHVYKLVEPR